MTDKERLNTEPAKAFLKACGTPEQWLAICASAAKRQPARIRELSATKRGGGCMSRKLAEYNPHFS